MLEYDLLRLTNFDGGDGLGGLWWFYGDQSSEVDIDVALGSVMTKPYAATTHGWEHLRGTSGRIDVISSDRADTIRRTVQARSACWVVTITARDGPTRSIAGTDTTSALQRRQCLHQLRDPPRHPADDRLASSKERSDRVAAMTAWMSDLSECESSAARSAIQQGLERERLDDRQIVRALVGQPCAVLEDPPVHQPMAVLEREPLPTRDERRLDVNLGVLDDVPHAPPCWAARAPLRTTAAAGMPPSTTSRS